MYPGRHIGADKGRHYFDPPVGQRFVLAHVAYVLLAVVTLAIAWEVLMVAAYELTHAAPVAGA